MQESVVEFESIKLVTQGSALTQSRSIDHALVEGLSWRIVQPIKYGQGKARKQSVKSLFAVQEKQETLNDNL
ncbi:hypothetical protein BpHYR1_045964 [Brachionus plicatilis]|uniref:Uncharacterized protein n=1 Tax=Brachionus plicatilis TaxID=10195 RepID=A0A3M7T6W1_BRAPC|nr:hypothetical protein BpHYR1_045964 [Brachionus plicatilis]